MESDMSSIILAGRATYEDGSPKVGFVVELWETSVWEASGVRNYDTTTDGDGNWSFAVDSTKTWMVLVPERREITQDGLDKIQVAALNVTGLTNLDVIDEHTPGFGVDIEGVRLRDAGIGDGDSITWDGRVLFDKGADIASAAAITPGTDGNYFHITGTTTITSVATLQAGSVVIFEFDGVLTVTHNATSLILQGGSNLTTAAGNMVAFISEGSGNWRELFRGQTTGTLSVSEGGTGATSHTDGGVLIGKGTGAFESTGVLADSAMIVGDGTTNPAVESGTTLRTSIGVAIGTDVLAYDAGVQQIADLADPNADRGLFWDDSAGAYVYFTFGSGLTMTDTTLTASGGTNAAAVMAYWQLGAE